MSIVLGSRLSSSDLRLLGPNVAAMVRHDRFQADNLQPQIPHERVSRPDPRRRRARRCRAQAATWRRVPSFRGAFL